MPPKTIFQDITSPGTLVTAAFLNAIQNHRHDGANQDGSAPVDYAVSTGSGNAYALSLTPPLTAYTPGQPIVFKANFTNTGSATLNINGGGAILLKKNFNQNLTQDDIQSGQIVLAIYDGTYFQVFLLKNPYFYTPDTGAANAYAVAYSPALTVAVIGLPLRFKTANANTGASTLVVNTMAAIAIKRPDGTSLQANDILANAMITVIYDGTYYQLQSPMPPNPNTSIPYYNNNLTQDVALLNTSIYYDGPICQQPTGAGIWFASGQVTLSGGAQYNVKIWDGTTVFASVQTTTGYNGPSPVVSLSCICINPAGNIKISVKCTNEPNQIIKANSSGNGKDSMLTVIKLQ